MLESLFPQSDDKLFYYLLIETLKFLFASKDDGDEVKKFAIMLSLIAIVATEPLKVFLRKNIGKASLSLERLIIACILYIGYAVMLCYLSTLPEYEDYQNALIAGGVFYILFSLAVLILGIIEKSKGNAQYRADEKTNNVLNNAEQHIYRGDSVFFTSFINDKWNKEKVWLWTEPVFCLVLGTIVTVLPIIYNPILALIGAPIVVTSLSFWVNDGFQIKNVWNIREKKLLNLQKAVAKGQHFNEGDGFSSSSLI